MLDATRIAYPQSRAIGRPVKRLSRTSSEFRLTLLLSLAHLPLGVLLYNVGPFAILHPIAVFSLGVFWAVQKRTKLDRVALSIAYLIGAEVLWRMAKVPVPWEFGKYGSVAIIVIALLNRRPYKLPTVPLIYFIALIPACIFPFLEYSLEEARQRVSFTLSGPLLLAASCCFFANVKTTPMRLQRLMLAMLIPLLSVAFATFFYTVTAEHIQFNNESNFATSGGFGPNQVSSMLGLGVFVAACCLASFNLDLRFKILLGIAAVFLAAQSVLTFSRGGMYAAVGASLVLIFFQFRNAKEGTKRLLPILVFSTLFILLVFPALDNFTGGKLQERFDDAGTSNRVEIAQTDFVLFFEYPLTGVGVALADEYRQRKFGYGAGSHTEFSRLVSEHGVLGITALVSLIAMALINLRRQRSTLGRALVAGISVWCVLFMINAGMRLAAPSFLWGLTFITIVNYPPRPRIQRPPIQ